MSSETVFERVVVEGDDHPLVVLLTDTEPTRLKARARELCDDRWPHWSRSYSSAIALVAGWRHRVGVDIELLHRATEASWSTADERFRDVIMTPEERKHLLTLGDDNPGVGAVSLWCSKEALAKALGTPLQMDPTRLTGPALWDESRRGAWRATSLDLPILERDAVGWVVYESRCS
jgi:hypothetical protein